MCNQNALNYEISFSARVIIIVNKEFKNRKLFVLFIIITQLRLNLRIAKLVKLVNILKSEIIRFVYHYNIVEIKFENC